MSIQQFHSLLQAEHTPLPLIKAQQILVRSGAVSYCCYHLIDSYKSATKELQDMKLPVPTPIRMLLEDYLRPLDLLLRSLGLGLLGELAS